MINLTALVELLEREITQRGWSQRKAAAHAGIPVSTLSDILNQNTRPTPETLRKIAEGLSLSVQRLMELAGYPVEENGIDDLAFSPEELAKLRRVAKNPDQRALIMGLIDQMIRE